MTSIRLAAHVVGKGARGRRVAPAKVDHEVGRRAGPMLPQRGFVARDS